MWVLCNVYKEEAKCFKVGQNTVKVGRKDSDLCLGNDPSISRQHAEISIVIQDGKEFLQVVDVGSRYGTYINNNIQPVSSTKIDTNNKMTQHSKVLLKPGDKIRFGLQGNIWFVEQKTYAVSSSKLDPTMLATLQSKLGELNIPFKSEWDTNCTHLTMSGIVVTPKVVSALASGKYIVTLDFWTQLSQVLSSGVGLYPKEDEFLPPIKEQAARYQSMSFLPNPIRSKLFKGLKFVALSQHQMRYLEQCVTLAGGVIVNMNREKFTKGDLLNEKTIVLSKSSLHVDSQQSQVNNVVERLKSLFAKTNKRLVDESEIGFAIMFASRDSACNPYVQFNLPEYSQSLDSSQDSDSNVFSASMIRTPHTARKRDRSPDSEGRESKRLHSDSNGSMNDSGLCLGRKRGYEEDVRGEVFRSAELKDLQDRGLIHDEFDSVSIDSNCCVISVEFKLKEFIISPRLVNKKVFKKQSVPRKPQHAPIIYTEVTATIPAEIKPDIGTPCKVNGINGGLTSGGANGNAFDTPSMDLDGTFEGVSSQE